MLASVAATTSSALSSSRTAVGEIAFSVKHGDGDSPWDIYVVRTDGRWILRKTTRLQESDPVWSPNGRQIAFYGWAAPPDWSGSRGWVYTMNPDGRQRRRLAKGSSPQWSTDGRRIAYDNNGVYVMNVDGTGKRRIARGGGPRWSPDGKQIAFTRAGDVYVVHTGGGGERRLTRTGDNDLGAWAPGSKIVFTHSAVNGAGPASGIYIINADGTGLRTVSRVGDYVTPSVGGWSPDSNLVVYAAGHGIATWRLSNGSVRRLRRSSDDWNPTWDRQGRQIAFTHNAYATTRGNGIWVVNRDGSGARRIAVAANPYPHQQPNEYDAPAWAPR